MSAIPDAIRNDLEKARRLEYWTIFWQATIVVVMFLVMGSSQAMKTAWIEDLLGLVPARVFLLALHFEQKPPSDRFPYGFARVNSLAFTVSAAVLLFMGLYLIFDSGMKLVMGEHPTLGPAPFVGPDLWIGWMMCGALLYSVIPPVILGHLKQPVARRLQDKVLYTDSLMQKADWMTGLAGIAGIIGVGYGFWWADSAAAMFIAFGIVNDGRKQLFTAMAELVDGAPRKLESDDIHPEAIELAKVLRKTFPNGEVRLRESGRFILAQVDGEVHEDPDLDALWPGDPDRRWRFRKLTRNLTSR